MRTFLILFCLCGYVVGASDIRVITTARTNAQTGAVTMKEFYTRDGKTNLVRHTSTKAGAVRIRIHRFYHDGLLVGDYVVTPNSSGFTTEAGTPFMVSFEYHANKDAKAAIIASKSGEILDAFIFTNSVFSPVEGSQLRKLNATGGAVRAVMEGMKRE